MTVVEFTPSEAPVRFREVATSSGAAHYEERPQPPRVERVILPASAPREIQVTLELGKEEAGVWAHIVELDVSAEGADAREAFSAVLSAAREWLAYIRDEQPALAPELGDQQRYVPLLESPVFSWFKTFRFAE